MKEYKLKKCPCCGGLAYIESWKARKGYEANVFCNDCRLGYTTITYDTEEQAIERAVDIWNSRSVLDLILEKLEISKSYSCSPQFNKGIDSAISIIKNIDEENEEENEDE